MTPDMIQLREANAQRQHEWEGSDRASIAFRALEVANEAGEVAGAVKKMIRAQDGICGSTSTTQDVADEIGDTVIALDLLAASLRLSALEGDAEWFDLWIQHTPDRIALALDSAVGNLSAAIERHILNMQLLPDPDPNVEGVGDHMASAVSLLHCLAVALGINARSAVIEKFNKTSAKYGLKTKMEG